MAADDTDRRDGGGDSSPENGEDTPGLAGVDCGTLAGGELNLAIDIIFCLHIDGACVS